MQNWLKHATKALAPKRSVISEIKANLGGFRQPRSHEVVHASDVTDKAFCPRETALLHELGKVRGTTYLSTALEATFDIGHATADLVKQKWLGPSAVGHWECQRCHLVSDFCAKPTGYAHACGHKRAHDWRYLEVQFEGENGLSCSIDSLVNLGGSKLTPVELKIMKAEDFDKLVMPLAEHRIRTNLYLHLIATSQSPYRDYVQTQEARVLYVSRGYGKANPHHAGEILPFKEYTVTYNAMDLAEALAKGKQVHDYKTIGILPVGICGNHADKRAVSCNVRQACFSGAYPAGKTCVSAV